MSVAAGGAVSTQQHQPTQEQIRLAQLIDDKKHDQPEVQEIVRKVLDVVANSNQEDALLALYDCDYDYERAVALLIEKGHEVASEWRTATNHKLTKKQQQQQQKVAALKNGHGGDVDENGHQRGNDNFPNRGKSRGGRSKYPQNEGDSQNNNNQQQQQQQNDNYVPQQRQRGGSGFRGRFSGNNRGGFRGNGRNYHQQQQQQHQQTQDLNVDPSSSSDTTRRNRGAVNTSEQQQQQDQFDVGNWNGETLIYSRTANDDEQPTHSDDSSAVTNGKSDTNNSQKPKPEFDPIEAARQIKNVIGIGQTSKSSVSDQQQKSKSIGQTLNTKVTPPPQQQIRIPQQPVIFSDRFDGGMNKIDVQFGNLGESFDESSAAFYQQSASIPSNKLTQRTTEQSAHISPATQPVINQQRVPQTQIHQQQQQQPSMTIKPVVTQQYAVHQQQQPQPPPHQINGPNILLQSLLFHQQQQQPEAATLDTSYDPTTFSLPPMDFNSPYYMAAPMNQQQTQPRYIVSQPPPQQQQTSTKNAQAPTGSAATSATTAKKAPAVPPGMFPPTAPIPQQQAYSTNYGVQQQTGGTSYPYDTEHLFTNAFMPLTNPQQTQSPTATYGSVTPPVQQQNQQQTNNNNNDNKTMNYRPPLNENLMLLQQYQQFTLQQTNNQQQGQQPGTHSPAPLSYYLSHPPSGPSYSPGHQMMYAQAAMAQQQQQQQQQQQVPKQQGQQYNQNNPATGLGNNDDYYGRSSSSSNKDGQYMYAAGNQPQHVPPQSTGQQQGVNKQQQQQQRNSGNVYNNHQGPPRSFQ